jgi:hypothetical protein
VVYVEARVPGRSRVEVVATTADPTANIVIADQPDRCSDSCGFEPSFGFEGTATMVLDNPGYAAKTFFLLVESRPGWGEDSTPEAPNVLLRSRLLESR